MNFRIVIRPGEAKPPPGKGSHPGAIFPAPDYTLHPETRASVRSYSADRFSGRPHLAPSVSSAPGIRLDHPPPPIGEQAPHVR